jgi:small subunit ribosomal protein S6e
MAFKINISDKSGKTYKLESEAEFLIDKELHDKFDGKELSPDLEGYELEITGASDKSGFTAMKEVPGIGLKRLLLGYGKGMKRRPKHEGKKKRSNNRPKGLRLRKTVRGRVISSELVQINLKVSKPGKKTLEEIYAPKEEAPAEQPAQ